MKYIAKELPIIEAEQFLPPYKIPKGVINVYQMGSQENWWYTGEIWTIQEQKIQVKKGEWIVTEKNNPNRHYPIADKEFNEKYKPLA